MNNLPELKPIALENAVVEQLHDPLFIEKEVEVFVKREDQIHPQVSGNKWRKLKYNLEQARAEGHTKLLTFGGAYSNHVLATAAAGALEGFETIGVIRGEEHLPLNGTLAFAKKCGMELHYIDRQTYRQKHDQDVQRKLLKQFGDCFIIPEGGSNVNAVKGCAEVIDEVDIDFDYLCTACGTGGTLAGAIAGLKGNKQILGFPVLKGGQFLFDDVKVLLAEAKLEKEYFNWALVLEYHFGGYAKKPELEKFIQEFEKKHKLPIEFVYTGKLFFGIYDLIKNGYFEPKSTILALHTGGLRNF